MDAEVVVVDVAGPEAPSPGEAAGARAEPSEGAQLFGASDAGEKTYTVVCPAGAAPGDQLQIDIEDETLLARVPEGVGPGETFPVTAPRAGAAPPPAATPVAMPPPTVATPVRSDEDYARELQRRELGLLFPPAAGRPRAASVELGGGDAYALSDDEQLVVNYRHSIKCFALVHGFLAMLNALAGRWGLLGLALLAGPVAGYVGAHRLDARLVAVYAAFCVLSVVFELALFLLYMSFWIFMFFVIKMWITQIVFKFWRVLSRLSADRARTLSRPLTVHNRRAVMVYY